MLPLGILGPYADANERDTGEGRGSQDWNRGLGSARRQYELEERHRIAELRLEWTERAVPRPTTRAAPSTNNAATDAVRTRLRRRVITHAHM